MRRVSGEGRMAYVLVAIGALMAVAGLYVIGYGWIDARYEEYWHALSAGATLTAGGLVTLALGFAVRALLQVKAALIAQPVAASLSEVPVVDGSAAAQAPADLETPAASHAIEPTIDEPEPHDASADAPPPQDPAISPPLAARERHPLRPPPTAPQDYELVPAAAANFAEIEHIERVPPETEPSLLQPTAPLFATRLEDDHDPKQDEADKHENIPVARPADDYKLAIPSATDHDRPVVEPVEAVPAPAPKTLPKTHDWFDRALADIDEELPLHAPSARPLTTPASPPTEKPAEPELEPAAVGSEPALEDSNGEAPAAPQTSPNSPVIGRYEAEGTSYVMYADGSIEAQSSAGVYRFGSMAELKAFIES